MHLIEEGRFEAYQLGPEFPWRISRSSFRRFLDETRDRKFTSLRSFSDSRRL
jgi:hypothetical protein